MKEEGEKARGTNFCFFFPKTVVNMSGSEMFSPFGFFVWNKAWFIGKDRNRNRYFFTPNIPGKQIFWEAYLLRSYCKSKTLAPDLHSKTLILTRQQGPSKNWGLLRFFNKVGNSWDVVKWTQYLIGRKIMPQTSKKCQNTKFLMKYFEVLSTRSEVKVRLIANGIEILRMTA